MNKYLIFRTDRIGDFLLSAILIKSIKRNDEGSSITLVASKKNYNYIKNINLVDEVIMWPTKKISEKIKFAIKIFKSKFYCIIVLDGKKRSLYCSILTKARYKISIVTKIFYKFIFKFNFTKIIYDDYSQNKIDLHKNALKILNFNIIEDDLNVLLNRKFNSTLNNSGISPLFENKAFIMLHFDEKWIFNDYIKSYKKIEPKINEFKKFVLNIVNTSKKNLIITNGISPNNITNNFRDELTKINTNCYHKEVDDKFIIYFDKTNFFDIEYLINKSELLISCHGAPTHVAAALNKKIFDIVDNSEEFLFKKFSHHFRNYNSFFRKDFSNLSKEIISRLG